MNYSVGEVSVNGDEGTSAWGEAPISFPTASAPEHAVGEVFDWRPKWGTDVKTSLFGVRLPDQAIRAMELVLEPLKFMYATKSDLARDAVWFWCMALYNKVKSGDNELEALLRNAKAAGDARWTANLRREVWQHTTDLHNSLLDALLDGQFEECNRQVAQFWDSVSHMSNDWQREKYLRAVHGSALLRSVVRLLRTRGYKLDPDCVAFFS